MKKYFFLAACAALTLGACSNDELVHAPAQSSIGFDTYIGKVSRADDATLSNVNSITVYGYLGDAGTPKLFDGTIVNKVSGDWTYSPLQYWTAGKSYFFTAVASPVLAGNSNYQYSWAENLPTAPESFYGAGTISFDNEAASGNEDVIYATATALTPAEITTAPSRVAFAFKHALSRVKFTFKNSMGSEAYGIKIHSLQINNAASDGTLELGAEKPVWAATGSTILAMRSNYFTPANGTAANNAAVSSGTKFIIPEEKALSINFLVDLIVNGTVIETYAHSEVVLPSVLFENGFSYNFVAELNPENINPEQELYPILFTVTSVEDWTENEDTIVTL